ncbi:MAG TPA: ABC transporter ATP-binding protein, partial [Kofleriaceae bacterium]|nr:ABC transporter ATP-binding protein [Kofleriaceae bacterium]
MTDPAIPDAFDLARMTVRGSIRGMLGNGRRMLRLLDQAVPGALRWLAVAAVLEASAATVLPYSTKRIVDAVARAGGIATGPVIWMLVEAGVVTTQTIARNLASYQTNLLEVRGTPFLVARILDKINRVAYRLLESPAFLDKLSRARQDAGQLAARYALQIVALGRWLLIFLGGIALLLWIAPAWTAPLVVASAALPFAIDVARARRSFEIERANLYRNRQGWYLEWLLSTSDPAKELRATGASKWLLDLYARIHAPFLAGQTAVARRHFARGWLAAIGAAAVQYGPYGYFLIITVRGERTIGDLLLFVLSFRQATLALAQLLTAFAAAFELHPYVSNLFHVLDHSEEVVDADPSPRAGHLLAAAPEFEMTDVWFTYPGAERAVIRGLDLRVRAGETLAIVGRNGIGKTTLVKLVLGLHAVDRGTIKIGGIDAASQTASWRHDNIGVVFQDFVRYQFSAKWNVGLGWAPDADDEPAIARALDMAQAGPIVAQLSAGVDTPLGAAFGGRNLSGGQWQRIALARLFMRKSLLWILDEPTAAMDPEAEEQVVQCFRQWTAGRTAIVITHRFSTARIADRIA